MFESLAHSPLGFWIIAVLIIIADSSLLLTPGRVTFTFRKRLSVNIRVVEHPYLLKGREPIITLFTYPFVPFFVASSDQPSQEINYVKRLLLGRKRIVRNSRVLANIALVSLLLVGVVGPAFSLEYGIERALIATMPAAYTAAFIGLSILYLNRSVYGLDGGDLAHIGLEFLLCPVLLVNVFKRIATRQPLLCTNDLVNHFSEDPADLTERLLRNVEATRP